MTTGPSTGSPPEAAGNNRISPPRPARNNGCPRQGRPGTMGVPAHGAWTPRGQVPTCMDSPYYPMFSFPCLYCYVIVYTVHSSPALTCPLPTGPPPYIRAGRWKEGNIHWLVVYCDLLSVINPLLHLQVTLDFKLLFPSYSGLQVIHS